MNDRNKNEEREDLPPKTADGSEEPDTTEPGADRRRFLVELGSMSFLTAAVVKLGVSASAETLDVDTACVGVGVGGSLDPKVLDIDTNCNKPSGKTPNSVQYDSDCGKPKSDGDQDCGQPTGTTKTSTWADNDCSTTNGPDNDCGKPTASGWTWNDNDCKKGGEDQDCGKPAPLGTKWDDHDGS